MLNKNINAKIIDYSVSLEKNGWVNIPNFFDTEFAESLYKTLLTESRWEIATIRNSQPFIVSLKEFKRQTPQFQQDFMMEVLNNARKNDFQYFYEFIRLVGADSQEITGYEKLISLIQSENYQKTLCQISNLEKNSKIDAQLTKYSPGCFLKKHCDTRLEYSDERHIAIIIGLTKNWRADFGGLLLLQDSSGKVVKTIVPEFNSLNILSIPYDHFVSQVANYSNTPRFSLIGWLWKAKG